MAVLWTRGTPAGSNAVPPQRIITDPGDVEMVLIPGGTFLMGSPESEKGGLRIGGPQHEVTLPAFYIGRYQVTNEEYGRYLDAFPRRKKPENWSDDTRNQPRLPVVGVGWREARAFAKWISGRLPTEAEWEYAARAGTTEPYLIGKKIADLKRVAWYQTNSKDTAHPVGKKEANAWGLHDVLGNVWEWCEDWWHLFYVGAPSDGSAWLRNREGNCRVLRGGAFLTEALYLRVAYRGRYDPKNRNGYVGFRVVCVPGGQN